MIRSIDWAQYELMNGPAGDLGERLSAFVSDSSSAARPGLWQSMENQVFAQDDIFSAAEPAIGVLLAALVDERPDSIRLAVLDLLFHLVQAASFRNDDLGRRCLDRAAEGGWLLVRQAAAGGSSVAEACLEVLDVCAPECAQAVRLRP